MLEAHGICNLLSDGTSEQDIGCVVDSVDCEARSSWFVSTVTK